MITIYKYYIPLQRQYSLWLPADAEILAFQAQGEGLFIWAKVDADTGLVEKTFAIEGTGFDISDRKDWIYIDTVQLDGFVWHLFEKPQCTG